MSEPIRITHLITGLRMGGAEMMLYKLIKGTQGKGFNHHVISLTSDGPIGERIASLGVPVEIIGMGKNLAGMLRFFKARKRIQQINADILQTWLYHADLMGRLFAKVPLVWNVQNGKLDPKKSPLTTRIVQHLCARHSAQPRAIIYCAENALTSHEELGYQNPTSLVIENGTEMDVFHPDPKAYLQLRETLSIPLEGKIVGHAGRYDAQKDYPTMIATFGLVAKTHPDTHFLLCGRDLTPDNQELMAMIQKNGMADRIHLLGLRRDMEQLLPALDVFVLTSAYGEAFPNVLGEAMACGVPCVSTDVGDARRIIGEQGAVVPVKDIQAIAQSVLEILNLSEEEKIQLSEDARRRIEENYSITHTLQKYQQLYLNLP